MTSRNSPLQLPERMMVVMTLEFVDEILWCDHSNETL